jgi:hypothetical protein
MKKTFHLLIVTVIVALAFSACLNTNAPAKSNNADIALSLKSATATALPSITFSRQDVNNADGTSVIYTVFTNADSLPYLTKPDSLIPIISGNSLFSITIHTKDTTIEKFDASKPDTLDFSDTVQIVTVAEDEKTTKTFKIVVNIHQNDPDLYTWIPRQSIYSDNATAEKLLVINATQFLYLKVGSSVKLYVCENEKDWTATNLTGFPNGFDIKYIFQTDDKLYIAQNNEIFSSQDGISWSSVSTATSIDNLLFSLNNEIFGITKSDLSLYRFSGSDWEKILTLPDKFPVDGAGICVASSVSGSQRAFFVGGEDKDGTLLSSVWSTYSGTYFTNLGATSNWFSPRRDVCAIQYDNEFMMIGGKDNALIIGDFFYVSPDYGLSWREPYENMTSNEDIFVPRLNLQAALNKEKTKIYFVGGQNGDGTFVKDAWIVLKNSVLWESMK